MSLHFEAVTIDENYGDEEAVLVYRGGRLLAIVSRLGPGHGNLAGGWYVEKMFGSLSRSPDMPFPDRKALEGWFADQLSTGSEAPHGAKHA
jgi:hypothetical protein